MIKGLHEGVSCKHVLPINIVTLHNAVIVVKNFVNMKGICIFVAFFATCVLATVDVNQCPEDYSVEKLFPHENCGQYYQCVHGFPLERTCPTGLHFNDATWSCDFPLEANCMNKPSELCPENWTGLIGHEDCNKFYQCVDGVAHEFSCPPGLHFNVESLSCDWADNANCENGPVDVVSSEESSDESTVDSKPDLNCSEDWTVETLLPHEKCNMFYKCTYGVPVEMACQQGLVYNSETLQCDWPENVDCSGRD